jgi:hypothetical protein
MLTVDQAIAALQRAREEVGGEAPLLMADGLHVVKLPVGDDGCVYVCDLPQPGDEEEFARDLGGALNEVGIAMPPQ